MKYTTNIFGWAVHEKLGDSDSLARPFCARTRWRYDGRRLQFCLSFIGSSNSTCNLTSRKPCQIDVYSNATPWPRHGVLPVATIAVVLTRTRRTAVTVTAHFRKKRSSYSYPPALLCAGTARFPRKSHSSTPRTFIEDNIIIIYNRPLASGKHRAVFHSWRVTDPRPLLLYFKKNCIMLESIRIIPRVGSTRARGFTLKKSRDIFGLLLDHQSNVCDFELWEYWE